MKYALVLLALLLFSSTLGAQEKSIRDSIGIEMNLVQDGSFLMGDAGYRKSLPMTFQKDHVIALTPDGETPAHPVIITRPFYLGTKEVTVAQFRKFVEDTGYVTTAEKSGDGIVGWHNVLDPELRHQFRRFKRAAEYTWKNPGFEQGDDHPVVGVSWKDAVAFCEWLSKKEGGTYRLPTEAEWEYACGAGSPEFFSFGDDHAGNLNRFANYGDITLEEAHENTASGQWFAEGPGDGAVFTSPVGSFEPNAWGFHDMHGNVWEHCQDYFNDIYFNRYKNENNQKPRGRGIDPVNLDQPWNEFGDWRVTKGGCWAVCPARCRRGMRGYFEANDGGCYNGFRVARDAEGPLVDEAKARHERREAARTALEAEESVVWWIAFNEDYSVRLVIDGTLASLAEHLPHMPDVTALEINGRGMMDAALLPVIGEMKQLRKLKIYDPGTKTPAEAYEVITGLENLEALQIGNRSSVSVDTFVNCPSLENLRVLEINNLETTSADLAKFRGKSFSNLQTLLLGDMSSDGTGLAVFEGAPLTQLRLRSLTDAGAREVGKFKDLESLEINEPKITGAGFSELSSLTKLKSLRLTNLKELEDADFAPLANMTGLESLGLIGSGAGDLTAEIIAKLPRLRNLSIGSPAFTDAGMRHIGSNPTFSYILQIGPEAAVTDDGYAQLWAPNRMTYLIIHQNEGITGRGFAAMADELEGIQNLDIRSGDLDDEGLRNLGYLPNLQTLKIQARGGRNLEGVSVKGLLDLAEAPKLETVELQGSALSISEADLAQVKEKRPGLKVTILE